MKAKKCSLFSFHWPVEVHTRRHADMHTKLDIRIRVIRNELLNWPVRIQSRITRCRRLRKIHKIQFDNCSSTAAPHGMAWHGTNWNWNTSNLIENFIKINQIAERQSALVHTMSSSEIHFGSEIHMHTHGAENVMSEWVGDKERGILRQVNTVY